MILFCVLLIPLGNLNAADQLSLGRQAEQAGKLRQALNHYVEALKEDVNNLQLREDIIKLAIKIQPPPEIPDAAARHLARGNAAFKSATDEQDYSSSADEFSRALNIAPWDYKGYFDLGVVLDKAGKYDQAIKNLKLYLLAQPNDKHAKNLMYEVEYRMEKAQKQKVAKISFESLSGTWDARLWFDWGRKPNQFGKWGGRIKKMGKVTIQGDNFKAVLFSGEHIYKGIISEKEIKGTVNIIANNTYPHNCPPGRSDELSFTGTIIPGVNKIILSVPDSWEGPSFDHNDNKPCKYIADEYRLSVMLER
jgi:tetratricopeptide (TPR) repeat protein